MGLGALLASVLVIKASFLTAIFILALLVSLLLTSFVFTSKFEGLPNVLLEALSLKKFVISTNCPTGPSEILLRGKAGYLFEIGNYKQLAKKILIHYKRQRRNKLMTNYGYLSLSRYDYKKNCEKYFNLILDYLKNE